MRLFGNSLTGVAFSWYTSLPPVQNWQQLEQLFHTKFDKADPEVTMADLARLKQQPGESAEKFVARFRMAKSKCFVREFVKLAQNGLNFELRKRLQDREFTDLFQLVSCAAKYEQPLREEEQRRNSSKGTYYQDPNVEANVLDPDVYLSDSDCEAIDINVAELTAGKPYTCKALTKPDSKSSDRSQNSKHAAKTPQNEKKKKDSFDITKADSIFDQLYQDKEF